MMIRIVQLIWTFFCYISITSCGLFNALALGSLNNDSTIFKPRYQYRPVQTQLFKINLEVKSIFKVGNDTQASTNILRATARAIPFQIDSTKNMHFMSLLSDGIFKRDVNGTEDSSELTIWATKRVELVMNDAGVIKQILDIENLPPLPITGYSNPDENGLRVLLTSFFPRLPDSISFSVNPILTIQDSILTTYPEKTVKRSWQEKTTYKLVSISDSSIHCSFDSRLTATDMIYPKNFTQAKSSEDQIGKGSFTISNNGKLLEYNRITTIYRSIQLLDGTSTEQIEETTTIDFTLKKM